MRIRSHVNGNCALQVLNYYYYYYYYYYVLVVQFVLDLFSCMKYELEFPATFNNVTLNHLPTRVEC